MFNKTGKLFLGLILSAFFILPTSVLAGKAEGGQIDGFDVQPRSIQGGQLVNFTFKVTLFSLEIRNYCGPIEGNLRWVINKRFPGESVGSFKNGEIPFDQFINGVSKDLSFSAPLFTVPTSTKWIFSAKIYCGVVIPSIIAESKPIEVMIQGGQTGGQTNQTHACITNDGKYACSPGDLFTCSDAPSCSGKQCINIDKTQCGQVAANGVGCGTPGQPDCKAGETQEYFFEIDNPLKGGANDFAGLVEIIAQWIFNLAIPIAVAMIVYAGILFLISAGDTSKVTKAKQVLTYAVIGLAIILIGNGFVTLIQSILKLGGTGQETQQGPGAPEGPDEDYGPPAPGAVGNKCSRDRDCFSGLKCKNTICQRPTGNLTGEPCNGGASCDVGLACDATSDGQQVIDGQTLGTCFETAANGGRIGDVCQKDSNCISGLKCNQICQRKDGNLNGEVCLKTSNPSNCQSKACHTVGTVIEGDCVPYSGT